MAIVFLFVSTLCCLISAGVFCAVLRAGAGWLAGVQSLSPKVKQVQARIEDKIEDVYLFFAMADCRS